MRALKLSCVLMGMFLTSHTFSQEERKSRWGFPSLPVTRIAERTAIANMFLGFKSLSDWMTGNVDLPYIAKPNEFCPSQSPSPFYAETVTVRPADTGTPPPSSFESLIVVAGQFNRTTARGRRNCGKALTQWYQENSQWSELSVKERLDTTLTLMKQQKQRLENERNHRFHPEFDISILACVGRREDASRTPETITNTLCNRYCNNNPTGVVLDPVVAGVERPGENCVTRKDRRGNEVTKNLAHGMGQIMPKTFWGWLNPPLDGYAHAVGFVGQHEDLKTSQAFARLGERPDIQMAMKVYHMNDNLKKDFLGSNDPGLRQFRERFLGTCFDQNTPKWMIAVAYYDRDNCSSYVQKVKRCREKCFDGKKSHNETLNCLLDKNRNY